MQSAFLPRLASRATNGLLTRAQLRVANAASRMPVAPLLVTRRWNQQAAAESHIFDDHDALRRRLLYRSKQRGWLEMDIMLGNWVRARTHTHMSRARAHTLGSSPIFRT